MRNDSFVEMALDDILKFSLRGKCEGTSVSTDRDVKSQNYILIDNFKYVAYCVPLFSPQPTALLMVPKTDAMPVGNRAISSAILWR